MIIKNFSKALYSSWHYYAPDRILFDCGEGAALHLKQEIFAVQKIVLSHGHIDHISGLLSFLCLRQSTKGDTEKPLDIYYPEGDRSIGIMIKAANEMFKHFLKYELNWHPINPGSRVELKKGRYLEAFKADHGTENPLIFTINEDRKRLKKELQGTAGQELAKIPNDEKYDYNTAKVLAYSGDSMPVDPDVYRNAKILIHEATFLTESDRKHPIHSTAQEAFDLAKEANVERLILCHISPRYFPDKIAHLLSKLNTHEIPYEFVMPDKVNCFE